MSEMKACRCCGTKQNPVEEKNAEYETLVRLVLESGDERQLVTLIDLMCNKITTCVTTSQGPYLLAYPEKDLWHAQIIQAAAAALCEKLIARK